MYLDLARELKKRWNMRVTAIPNVVEALRTPESRKESGGGWRSEEGSIPSKSVKISKCCILTFDPTKLAIPR